MKNPDVPNIPLIGMHSRTLRTYRSLQHYFCIMLYHMEMNNRRKKIVGGITLLDFYTLALKKKSLISVFQNIQALNRTDFLHLHKHFQYSYSAPKCYFGCSE